MYTFPLQIPIGINYKVLMSGEVNPLTTLSSALTDNNVHVVAKLADKIPIKVRFFHNKYFAVSSYPPAP